MSVEKFNPIITGEVIPYTMINTLVVQNIKNIEAGFVWVYLLTLPPNWIVVKQHLKNHFKLGDDKIKQIFSYLKKNNLIDYVQNRDINGRMLTSEIKVLNGNNFIFETNTAGVKIPLPANEPVDKSIIDNEEQRQINVSTAGVKTTPPENHTCGSGALQIKQNTNQILLKNKTKSFYKEQNEKKHEFAANMDQMANENKHIEEHEKIKRVPMPDNIREIFKQKGILRG